MIAYQVAILGIAMFASGASVVWLLLRKRPDRDRVTCEREGRYFLVRGTRSADVGRAVVLDFCRRRGLPIPAGLEGPGMLRTPVLTEDREGTVWPVDLHERPP